MLNGYTYVGVVEHDASNVTLRDYVQFETPAHREYNNGESIKRITKPDSARIYALAEKREKLSPGPKKLKLEKIVATEEISLE
jgi:hypothetical protein